MHSETRSKLLWIVSLLIIAAVCSLIYTSKQKQSSTNSSDKTIQDQTKPRDGVSSNNSQPKNPNEAKASALPETSQATQQNAADKARGLIDPGKIQPVKWDANEQVKSVAEALKNGDHPERLSALVPATPFNRDAFLKAPQEFLKTVEPGRCFQTAQPGPDIPRLMAKSPLYAEIRQGEVVTLRVKGAPNALISMTSFDLGAFENKLTAISVQANEVGLAEVKFFGTPGTTSEAKILAGSPMASGMVQFVVNVKP